MKKYLFTAAILLAGLATFSACQDDDVITPSGNYSPIRGGFPQGTSKYDTIINNIKKKYDVYLIYKDITEEDLNRDWVSAGTGDLYVAGYEEERNDAAWNLPNSHLPFYVDYFNNYIFPNINDSVSEFIKSSFPVKIYMIHNLRTEPRDFGDSIQSGGTETDPYKSIKLGNFDNWAISFKEDIINGSGSEEELKKQRCIFMIQAIYNATNKGEITSPDEFWEGFDFSGEMEHEDTQKANYRYKLGFIDDIYDHYATTGRTEEVWNPKTYIKKCEYWAKGNKDNDLFAAYIKNAMWLTPEEFEARYPKSLYPLPTEKYNIVVNHMKDKYGIDLVGIAKGLKE